MAQAEFKNIAGGIDGMRCNLGDGGVDVGLRGTKREPCGQRRDRNGPGAVAVGGAVVINKLRFNDRVSNSGLMLTAP